MLTMLRHALSILLLPFLVVVAIPYLLLTSFSAIDCRWGDGSLIVWLARSVGTLVFIVGFGLFSWCVSLFARVGQGTLAPWDPTRNLVAVGPYRFVRNPMISGVALMLIGQTVLWGSWLLGLWVCVFVGINHLYFVVSEEPGLERRFGENYRVYKANVPRWLPRLRPWLGEVCVEDKQAFSLAAEMDHRSPVQADKVEIGEEAIRLQGSKISLWR